MWCRKGRALARRLGTIVEVVDASDERCDSDDKRARYARLATSVTCTGVLSSA
jgi:hypothetical protein